MNNRRKRIIAVIIACAMCTGQIPVYTAPVFGIAASAETAQSQTQTDISQGYSAALFPDNMVYNNGYWNPKAFYTGEAQTVKAQVYSNSNQYTYLTEGVDYDITYENNVNVGEGTVTITGKGNYTGSFTKPLVIEPISLNVPSSGGYNVEMSVDTPVFLYSTSACEPTVTVKFCGKTLKQGTDYTLSYENNISTDSTTTTEATVTVTGIGNYTGEQTLDFNIMPEITPVAYGHENIGTIAVSWSLDANGVLTVNSGADAEIGNNQAWRPYAAMVRKIVIKGDNGSSHAATVNTKIGSGAFAYCINLTEVELPYGITEIGSSAFGNGGWNTESSTYLRSVKSYKTSTDSINSVLTPDCLPDSVTSIGGEAFRFCHQLTLNLPDNIAELGSYAFGETETGAKLLINRGTTTDTAFHSVVNQDTGKYCYEYFYYTDYPDFQTTSGNFGEDTVLYRYTGYDTDVTIPDIFDYVYCWGSYCNFKGYQVKSITVPASVKKINSTAFQNCYALRELTIEPGSNALELPSYMFYYGTNNLTFNVPDNVTRLPDPMFRILSSSSILVKGSCTALSSVMSNDNWKEDDGSGIGPRWSTTCTFGAPVYKWSDDFTSCTATAICTKNADHVVTETVDTTYEITAPATSAAEGEGVYTAAFTKSAFTAQTKTVTIPAVTEVTDITLDKNELSLEEGTSETLTATVKPDDATDKTVTWTSSDETVAAVDADGKVTAIKAGTATITAKAGDKTAACEVTVTGPVIPVTDITLDTYSLSLNAGDTAILTASVTPSYATDTTVTWTSSDEDVVSVDSPTIRMAAMADTVDSTCTITALKAGTATIKAKAGDLSVECVVTVAGSAEETAVDLAEGSVNADTDAKTVTVKDKDGNTVPESAYTLEFTFINSNNEPVTLIGEQFPTDTGTYFVTAKAKSGSGYKGSVMSGKFKVSAGRLKLTVKDPFVKKGETLQLEATYNGFDATESVTWKSSDETIATVDEKGLVTGIGAGKVTITAIADEEASCELTVIDPSAADETDLADGSISVDPLAKSVTIKDKDGNTVSESAYTLTFEQRTTNSDPLTWPGTGFPTDSGTWFVIADALPGSGYKGSITSSDFVIGHGVFAEIDVDTSAKTVTVKDSTGAVIPPTDYELGFFAQTESGEEYVGNNFPTDKGTYVAVAKGLDGESMISSLPFTVGMDVSISDAVLSVDASAKTASLTLGGKTLPSSAYTLRYLSASGTDTPEYDSAEFPTVPGTYFAMAEAKSGSGYYGEAYSSNFTVAGESEEKALGEGSIDVNTDAKTVTVKDKDGNTVPESAYTLMFSKIVEGSDPITLTEQTFPTEEGDYYVTALAKSGSGYSGHIMSEKFKVSASSSKKLRITVKDPTVKKGYTIQLKAEYNGYDATESVTWKSSDETIATVNEKGLVTGVKAGKAIITAIADEEAACEITVTDSGKTEKYSVSFDANGGTGKMKTESIEAGDYTLPECTFTAPDGKKFVCWLVGSEKKAPGDKITVSADVTIKASWEDKGTTATGTIEGADKPVDQMTDKEIVAAVADAKGDVDITLADDLTVDGKFTLPKEQDANVSVDGGGNTIIFGKAASIVAKNNQTVELTNVTIDAAKGTKAITITGAAGEEDSAGLILDDVTLVGKKATINSKKSDIIIGDLIDETKGTDVKGSKNTTATVDGEAEVSTMSGFKEVVIENTLTVRKKLNVKKLTLNGGTLIIEAGAKVSVDEIEVNGEGTVIINNNKKGSFTVKKTVTGTVTVSGLTNGSMAIKAKKATKENFTSNEGTFDQNKSGFFVFTKNTD